jgi:hypothetical protein
VTQLKPQSEADPPHTPPEANNFLFGNNDGTGIASERRRDADAGLRARRFLSLIMHRDDIMDWSPGEEGLSCRLFTPLPAQISFTFTFLQFSF